MGSVWGWLAIYLITEWQHVRQIGHNYCVPVSKRKNVSTNIGKVDVYMTARKEPTIRVAFDKWASGFISQQGNVLYRKLDKSVFFVIFLESNNLFVRWKFFAVSEGAVEPRLRRIRFTSCAQLPEEEVFVFGENGELLSFGHFNALGVDSKKDYRPVVKPNLVELTLRPYMKYGFVARVEFIGAEIKKLVAKMSIE